MAIMEEDRLQLLVTGIIRTDAVILVGQNEFGKTKSIFKIKKNRP
jgi:hypothetical protein